MPFRGGAHGGAEPAGGAAVYKVRAAAADAQFAELLAVLGSTGDAGVSWGSPMWLLCSGCATRSLYATSSLQARASRGARAAASATRVTGRRCPRTRSSVRCVFSRDDVWHISRHKDLVSLHLRSKQTTLPADAVVGGLCGSDDVWHISKGLVS